ncbi:MULTISPECIES: endolytic transglycosylase MltG [unclassified Actinopolyspora]|uniref:endolytic transglycosylase MltG n=1 Tax=unclassified Actinopolyspora TaxID=2639451 RepID=UPI0013F5FB2F|nr:endolytic transglycosylase MltG [Actinopolyspora sp. BKK2]NHE76736.1 endolytic transglycosylase MltG [Actinopolyspora sp. BKK1]
MNDDLDLFTDEAGDESDLRRQEETEDERFRRRRRRRVVTAVAGVLVLLIVVSGAVYGTSQLLSLGGYEDYEGSGSGEVVVQVEKGDTTSAIGRTLAEKDVVASPAAFVEAAEENRKITGIQPGFYSMRSRMSGSAAVSRIVSDEARAGRVEIRGGMQLADHVGPDDEVVPGIYSLLGQAACGGSGGSADCANKESLVKAASETPLTELGVPEWAASGASEAPDPKHRLEGLILPGIYHVEPSAAASQVLRSVLSSSFEKMRSLGFPEIADGTSHSPYELLKVSSLVQSEGIEKDFGKVARVVENRLDSDMRLQFDSTINYLLKEPSLLTEDKNRAKEGPYNTYQSKGLPPSPISAPSAAAVEATADPPPGEWMYFVKCQKDGTSCFSKTIEGHERAKDKAQRNGAY